MNHAAVGGPLERPPPLAVEGEEEIILELRREGGRPILVVGEILSELGCYLGSNHALAVGEVY